uniref:Alginate lyase 2 domain-containing protein n=1 Tax=Leersia perrieri TaxID=77586 RepID=A0A0D9XXC6_9ORYZ
MFSSSPTSSSWWLSAACLLLLSTATAADPTDGFTAVKLDESNFVLQKPYDVQGSSRYSFDGTVRRLWVFSSDKPHKPQSKTNPRTEIRMTVFGASDVKTTLMLHVYDGDLRYYDRKVVEPNIYDHWFRLNVIHDIGRSELVLFINGHERLRVAGHGGDRHYFKFGVYEQRRPSERMESRWRDVRILKKNKQLIEMDI